MIKSTYLIVGKHSVLEALKNNNRKVLKIFLTEESKKTIHRSSPDNNLLKNLKVFFKTKKELDKYCKNENILHQGFVAEIERLESEYGLAFSVYSELAKKVESQKIQVKENTPVFVVLKEAVIPLKQSSTPKSIILIMWSLFGVFTGSLITLAKPFLANLKGRWGEEIDNL